MAGYFYIMACESNTTDARGREAQVGKWSRAKKDKLINKMNPGWEDLYWDLV